MKFIFEIIIKKQPHGPPYSSHLYIYMTAECGGHARPRDKLNTLYLDLQEAYGNQTRQCVVLL